MFIVEAPILSSATTSPARGSIVDFVAVLQSERVDVDDHRVLACQLDGLLDVRDLVALARRHQNLERLRRFACEFVVQD